MRIFITFPLWWQSSLCPAGQTAAKVPASPAELWPHWFGGTWCSTVTPHLRSRAEIDHSSETAEDLRRREISGTILFIFAQQFLPMIFNKIILSVKHLPFMISKPSICYYVWRYYFVSSSYSSLFIHFWQRVEMPVITSTKQSNIELKTRKKEIRIPVLRCHNRSTSRSVECLVAVWNKLVLYTTRLSLGTSMADSSITILMVPLTHTNHRCTHLRSWGLWMQKYTFFFF